MTESYLLRGLLVGLVFGVPAGAIGALAIQRALTYGFRAGFFTGLGSSAADVIYACVGIYGLQAVSDFLMNHQKGISLAGGTLLIGMGIFIFRKKGKTLVVPKAQSITCFGSAFAVAITNPATILSFLLAFTAFGIGKIPSLAQGVQLIFGILLGTGCWWGLLSGVAAKCRDKVTERIYKGINRLLGILLALFGSFTALRALL